MEMGRDEGGRLALEAHFVAIARPLHPQTMLCATQLVHGHVPMVEGPAAGIPLPLAKRQEQTTLVVVRCRALEQVSLMIPRGQSQRRLHRMALQQVAIEDTQCRGERALGGRRRRRRR